jgi:hypothetical protein
MLGLALAGCGSSTNLNQIWGGNDEAGDTLLAEAQASYDRGDFEDAASKTEKLLARNPDHEAAAVLLGYAELSLGGIDPYRLARAMVNLDTSTTTGAKLADDKKTSTDSSDTLAKLATLINLTPEDFAALSDHPFDGELIYNENVETSKLLVPAKISDALRAKVPVLDRMNRAIKAVCRFVNTTVYTDDPRDHGADCTPTEAPRHDAAKAHFLWAFSHLTEALVFQSVLVYQSAENATTNFQKGADSVNTANVTTPTEIADFIDKVAELNAAVDAVFDTTSNDSMIRGTLLSLTATSNAFAEIAGLPDKIKARITAVLTKISEVGTKINGGAPTDVNSNTKALKGQLTEKFTKTLGGKIATATDNYLKPLKDSGVTVDSYEQLKAAQAAGQVEQTAVEDVEKMCTSFDNLTGSLDPTKKTGEKPGVCPK